MYYARLAELIEAGRLYRANPDLVLDPGLWPPHAWTRSDFRRWFRGCLHAKINRDDARQGWRKMQDSYQAGLARDVRIIRDAARGVRWPGCNLLSTPELQRRYPRIHNPERWP